MTHYWWMHWFWITCRLTVTHSTPLTPLSTVASQSQLEIEQNRSHRPLNLIDETGTAIPKPQVAITVPFPLPFSTTESKTSPSPSPSPTPTSCRNQTVNVNININASNSTAPIQLCSQTFYSDSLQQVEPTIAITTDDNSTSAEVSNTSVIVTQTHSKELISKKGDGDGEAVVESSWNAAAITGVSFGVLLSAAVLAAASVVLYRRRYLNKPQTLNDKCSNPDSSGYIDDSTMRENSEEMYSLDNDSFLNSLEAMTIQNYWTDSVKHTKL